MNKDAPVAARFGADTTGRAATAGGLSITPQSAAKMLILLGAFLLAAHSCVLILKYGFGYDYLRGFADKFHLNKEANLPTMASSLILMLASALLAYTAANTPKRARPGVWWMLAAVFLFLSIDETVQIHELLSEPTHNAVQADWLPPFAWVLPYGVAALFLGVLTLPWFLKLDRTSQIRFFIAGCIYVGGALGVELLEGVSLQRIDPTLSPEALAAANQHLSHELLTSLQECMEYVGSAYFLYALVRRLGGLHLAAGAPAMPQAAS